MSKRIQCRFVHQTLALGFTFISKCFYLSIAKPSLVLQFVMRIFTGVVEEGFGVFGVATIGIHCAVMLFSTVVVHQIKQIKDIK